MTKLVSSIFRLTILGVLVLAQPARAELRIEITRGVSAAMPIAVVPFGYAGPGSQPLDVAQVVADDLQSSGRFAPMARKDMLEKPSSGAEVDFQDWRLLNTQVLVVGRVTPVNADEYTIQFQVFDVYKRAQILGYRMPSSRAAMRASAHYVADMIYEKLTGIKGVFSTQVAYVTVTGTAKQRNFELVVADADGANPKVISSSPDPILSPSWSPDGRKLAYVSFEGGTPSIYVQILRTGFRQKVSSRRGVNGAPVWHPDGRRLALTLSESDGNLDIYSLELSNGRLERLTNHPAIDTEPEWRRDGRGLYFTSDRSGSAQIYELGVLDKKALRVTREGSYNARPRLSPDGKSLSMVTLDRGNYRIAVMNLERSSMQVLSNGSLDESPAFAPNGQTLIYAAREGSRGVLATVSADGEIRGRIASADGDVREPVWSPFPPN
jgi:TolB protein